MIPFKISCSSELRFPSKPNSRETAIINNQLPNSVMEVDRGKVKQLARMVGEQGVPFCPATFTGGERKAENFEQTQMIALDFDNKDPSKKVSFEAVKARAERYHLPCVFAYDTMSSSPNHDKFRMIFLNDVSVPSRRVAEVMINAIHTVFPEADSSCRDVSRLFYGGKHLLHFDDTVPEINILSVISGMTKYLEDKHGTTNYKRKVAEFIHKNHLVTNSKGMPDVAMIDALPLARKGADYAGVSDDNKISPKPYIEKEGFGEKLLNRYYAISFTNNTSNSAPRSGQNKRNHLEHRASVLHELRSQCQLFREFESGERQLHHMELFGLATSLTEIETGGKLFLDVVSSSPYTEKYSRNGNYWKHNVKNYIADYKPYACSNFCPYCDNCIHGTNMLSTLKVPYHGMVRIENHHMPLFPIEEVYEDFESKLMEAINSNNVKWYIIKAQTSLGKTEAYIRLLKHSKLRILIVVPTNKLKAEVKDRAAAIGVQLVASPSLHELKDEISDEAWDKIQHLYDVGASVLSYVKERTNKNHKEYEKAFETYLKQLDEFMKCSGSAITTHRRLLNLDVSDYDLVIVDEDIIFSSIISNRIEISVSKLKKLRSRFQSESPMARKLDMLLKRIKLLKYGQTDDYFSLPAVFHDKNEYDEIASEIGINVSAFADATRICYHAPSDSKHSNAPSNCISFLDKVAFSKDVKHIMVSATVDKRICEYYFGAENMEFYKCKEAPYTGNLKQYYAHPMSRAYIDKDPSIIDEIEKATEFDYTITFKKYERGDLYFGNTAGCDYMKEKNINVIGTPHQPEYIYKSFAHHIGLHCNIDARMNPNIMANRNGYAFRFTTYDDEVLRAIQFYMIESELEQAVGRARLLRYDCTVNLFSNYPLCQAEMLEWL